MSGIVAAIGDGAELASGGGQIGDEVLAYRVTGGYASRLNVAAADVFAKPTALEFPAAANLLLVGATAADMLHVTEVGPEDTVLIHGASGAVGVSALQQAVRLGARVIGTASDGNFPLLRRFGADPVAYGPGLADRVRGVSSVPVTVALDTVGTDEAIDVSLELVPDRSRIVTIAAMGRAQKEGILAVGASNPDSAAYRNSVRPALIDLAARGGLVVPVARTFALSEAVEALRVLQSGHPGGKLALIP